MIAWLTAVALADDVRTPTPTRVTPGPADIHLELPAGFARYEGPAGAVTLRGPLQVDLYDGWALLRATDTGQVHVVPRELVSYIGTNNPDAPR